MQTHPTRLRAHRPKQWPRIGTSIVQPALHVAARVQPSFHPSLKFPPRLLHTYPLPLQHAVHTSPHVQYGSVSPERREQHFRARDALVRDGRQYAVPRAGAWSLC